ncbi:50S ribosomal protein L13 [bacterium]|nr:50S ribosomal protein L13 [bacterium]
MEKTYSAKKEDVKRKWYLIDAKGKVLGKIAVKAAIILRGKHKPTYTPHIDTGDHVIVINASQVILTGKKLEQKYYRRHSGYPGGLKSIRYDRLLKEKPERVIELAIKGMLPKTKLGRAMFKKLRVYKGSEHSHGAQNPVQIEVKK